MAYQERRKNIWFVALGALILALAIMLAWLGYYAYNTARQKNAYHEKITSMYEKSYDEMSGTLSNISSELAKLKASGQNAYTALLLAKICRGAAVTQDMVGQLPLNGDTAGRLFQFSNQLGDFCDVLFQKVVEDQPLSKEDYEQLAHLEQSCQEVAQALDEERNMGIAWEEDLEYYVEVAEAPLPEEEMGLTKMAKNMEQYPKLIYDGPFSETAQEKEPQGVTGEEVSLEEAIATAQKYFPGSYEGEEEDLAGGMPSYSLTGTTDTGRALELYVTKAGGHLYSAMESDPDLREELKTGEENELDRYAHIAVEYLKGMGYGECTAAYAQFYYGRAIINLAPKEGEVVLYPDLIKVWVDMDNGEVCGMDANNYLMNHRKRDLPMPRISMSQARGKATSRLEIHTEQLVLIPPIGSEEEKLCYEFTGVIGEQEFVVFIHAETGREEDIYQIIDGENGKFAY